MSILKNALKAIGCTVGGVVAFTVGIIVIGYALAILIKTPLVICGIGLLGVAISLFIKFHNDDKKKAAEAEKNGQP